MKTKKKLMLIYQDWNTRKWFGKQVEGPASIVGPTFKGFNTRAEAVSTARVLGFTVVSSD